MSETATHIETRRAMLDAFKLKAMFEHLKAMNEQLLKLARDMAEAKGKLIELDAHYETTKARLVLTVNGKNAEERSAGLAIAVEENADAQRLLAEIRQLRAYIAEKEGLAAHTERQRDDLRLRIRLVDSALKFLAAEI